MGGFAEQVWNRDQAARGDQIRMQLAPLSQALQADQTRLAIYADPSNPSKAAAGKEKEYQTTLDSMTNTIGQMRSILGQKEPHHGVLDALHIRRDLQNRVANWNQQNQTMAGQYAQGSVPYEMTPEGQKLSAQIRMQEDLERQRAASAGEVERLRGAAQAEVQRLKNEGRIPKGLKLNALGEVPDSVSDQDTGKTYTGAQMNDPSTPESVRQLWTAAQSAYQQYLQRAKDLAKMRVEINPPGSWTVAEGEDGKTILYNSKTGQTRKAPEGLHKSGWYDKEVAPLESARLNIDDYIQGGVYDGAGDLALQHAFFTATQPSTGFRMTKVQQDILQQSRSWLQSWRAKVLHATTGQWYTDEQRKQIAKAAQDAIREKERVLQGQSGGPKAEQVQKAANGNALPPGAKIIKWSDVQ